MKQLFTWQRDYPQTNHYYRNIESPEKNRGTTIRIREKEGEFFLQVKQYISDEESLHINKEFEKKVDKVMDHIDNAELEELTGKKLGPVSCIGSLRTQRKESLTYQGISLCLDKSNYLGVEDYELEIEFTGGYPDFLVERLKKNGISFDKKSTGKKARFLERYKQLEESKSEL